MTFPTLFYRFNFSQTRSFPMALKWSQLSLVRNKIQTIVKTHSPSGYHSVSLHASAVTLTQRMPVLAVSIPSSFYSYFSAPPPKYIFWMLLTAQRAPIKVMNALLACKIFRKVLVHIVLQFSEAFCKVGQPFLLKILSCIVSVRPSPTSFLLLLGYLSSASLSQPPLCHPLHHSLPPLRYLVLPQSLRYRWRHSDCLLFQQKVSPVTELHLPLSHVL